MENWPGFPNKEIAVRREGEERGRDWEIERERKREELCSKLRNFKKELETVQPNNVWTFFGSWCFVPSFVFLLFLCLDNWGKLDMNLALDNINELSLMLLNKLVAFSYVKKCPSFYYL